MTIAPSAHDHQLNDAHPNNPFATPNLNPADLPTAPKAAARLPASTQRHLLRLDNSPSPLYFDQAYDSYKQSSFSSKADSSVMSPTVSLDLEKSSNQQDERASRTKEPKSRDGTTTDPEKAIPTPPYGSQDRQRSRTERIPYLEDDNDDNNESRQMQEAKAVRILLFLSGPCVVLSFLNTIWTLISLLITTFTQPVRICSRRPTFGQQLGGLLGPALNLQLRNIYTPLPPHADEDTSYRPAMLLFVQLLSPFLSLGMMLAAWVVAVFWLSSKVVGDPSGTDGRDDGRETCLALRDWWEAWLVRSMREEE